MTPNSQQVGDLTTAQSQYNAAPNPQHSAEQMMKFLKEQSDAASKSNLDAIALTNQRFSQMNQQQNQNPASGSNHSWSMLPGVSDPFGIGMARNIPNQFHQSATANNSLNAGSRRYSVW